MRPRAKPPEAMRLCHVAVFVFFSCLGDPNCCLMLKKTENIRYSMLFHVIPCYSMLFHVIHVIPCYSMLFPIWLRTPKKSELDSLKMFTNVHEVTDAYKCHDGQDGCPPKRKDVHLLLQGLCFWMFFLDRGASNNTWKPTDEPREMFVCCWH